MKADEGIEEYLDYFESTFFGTENSDSIKVHNLL